MLKVGDVIDFSLIKRKFIIKNEDVLARAADFDLLLIHRGPILDQDYVFIAKIRLIQRGRSAVVFSNSIHIHHLLR